jgi:very-short-patch-repair endonuclease
MDRVGLLYIRVFNELKGITSAMDLQITKVLSQAMLDGDGPRFAARKLVKTISGMGEDLGITDALGRYIPAMRRAEMLARTEMIRAHHLGMIQEYRNWALEGVYVLAEFLTAGDDRVCKVCAEIEAQGKEYTLDEAEGMIPVHPNCFIDPQIPIYTSKGWKPIGKIEIGDKVLTHKKRFRKVTALIRNKQKQPDVVTFTIRKGYTLSMTANHPVLIGTKDSTMTRWIEAGRVTKDMKIMLLANECKRCGKSIPYYRTYCTRTCLSLDITDKQWADPAHKKNMSEKASAQLFREYNNGTRDKSTISKKANDKVRQMVKDGKWVFWMDEEFHEKIRKVTNTSFLNACSSKRMTENNPMIDPVTVEKAKQSVAKYYLENPERRLNALMAKHRKSGNMTYIEKRLQTILDKLGIAYIYQYPIFRYNVDFAIPDLKIVIECDGEYWHQDKEKDDIRQKRIEDEGWLVLRYSGSRINTELEVVEQELSRVFSNHTGDYGLIAQNIISIKKWKAKHNVNLYNLTVDEDESYIAKGVVVHNCRCICLPVSKQLKENRLLY